MNRKIKRFFSILLVACMLFAIVQPHATFWAEEDSLTSELINEDEISTESDAEIEGKNAESALSLEQGISSSTISEEIIEVIEVDDETENSLSSDNEEVVAEQQDIITIADEETEEPENDNWELGLVFYDSTVDNGKTPLTEINWDASDGSYKEGTQRVITVQINYKNTNAITTYQQGELKITIPNLIYNTSSNKDSSPLWKSSVIVGANDSTHTGYDFDFNSNENDNIYIFTNANTIEEKSNFEGSIQIVYSITPAAESWVRNSEPYIEAFEDECIHKISKILKAEIKDIINSNEIFLNYERTYVHPWKKSKYSVTKTAEKIKSYDGFGENAAEYYWVKYTFKDENSFAQLYNAYPYIYCNGDTRKYKDIIPVDCIVLNSSQQNITTEDGIYSFNWNKSISIYVGYPKSIYNEENNNLIVDNTVEEWGTYWNETESEKLAEGSCTINLLEFDFKYEGDLYLVSKVKRQNNRNNYVMRYQDIINEYEGIYNKTDWVLRPTAIYSGKSMTLKIGDDLLYATNKNGNYEKLDGEDYYFSSISFNNGYLENGNGITIPSNKYDCEFWIKYKNTNDYVLFDSFRNSSKRWIFSKNDGVIEFYFIIYDVSESITPPVYEKSDGYYHGFVEASTVFLKKEIPENGRLYNFNYLQVYFKDDNGNLIFQNEPSLSSYNTLITKEEIANFDQETYNCYLQRGVGSHSWEYYKIKQPTPSIYAYKKTNDIIQDVINEKFSGSFTISCEYSGYSSYASLNTKYIEQYDSDYGAVGYKMYDLLPIGMKLKSSEKEILDSFSVSGATTYNAIYFDLLGNKLNKQAIKDNTKSKIKIIDNWKNTGRTRIEIVAEFEKPVYFFQWGSCGFHYKYDYEISYEDFLEYGNTYDNYCYVDKLPEQKYVIYYSGVVADDGSLDTDAIDIDEDGDTSNKLCSYKATASITSVISTHQDVTKYVKTDMSHYSTGTVNSSYDSEYEYKLRVRTGQNDITNLVIYDSIEEYAQNPNGDIVTAYGKKNHWNGEFLGIDTSYAESKGYVVKPYYSENVLAGNLYNDDGSLNSDWKEYSDDWDEYETITQTITSPNWPSNYKNNMTDAKDFWEVHISGAESLEINFDSTCRLESASFDYLRFYDKNGNNITNSVCGITANKIGGSDMAGKTYIIPGDYVKITMRTDGSGVYKGFSADVVGKVFKETHYGTDKTKVKALAFEYLDADGNAAVLPANSLTYVLIKMKSPADENITSLAYNGCRTQWQALDEHDRPVDFITGINSNIVKVSLPNSVEDKEVNLSFNKIISATDEDFEKLGLDKDADYNFFISLTNQETEEVINGLLDSKEGFRVNNIPIGTYIIEEQNDIWFHFISMALMEPIEGIEFKEENGAYIISIGASVESGATANIEVTNKPDEERFYDSKYDIKNLFATTM